MDLTDCTWIGWKSTMARTQFSGVRRWSVRGSRIGSLVIVAPRLERSLVARESLAVLLLQLRGVRKPAQTVRDERADHEGAEERGEADDLDHDLESATPTPTGT